MNYIEVTVLTTTEASEAVSYILEDEGASGIAIEDPSDFVINNKKEVDWDYVEPELIEAIGDDVKVKGYFIEKYFSDDLLHRIKSRVDCLTQHGLDKGRGDILTKVMKEEDWATS
ncbi:MAG: 50S ribosomal protein L11 methyltransferase, partial [Clostridiales bacterium]|nr:50S ribosomal protein L11 methyltransferase [Clostridiales bacterium]